MTMETLISWCPVSGSFRASFQSSYNSQNQLVPSNRSSFDKSWHIFQTAEFTLLCLFAGTYLLKPGKYVCCASFSARRKTQKKPRASPAKLRDPEILATRRDIKLCCCGDFFPCWFVILHPNIAGKTPQHSPPCVETFDVRTNHDTHTHTWSIAKLNEMKTDGFSSTTYRVYPIFTSSTAQGGGGSFKIGNL